MSAWHTRRIQIVFMVFAASMVGLAAWAWWRYGASIVAAVLTAIAVACVAAMGCVWWLSRRALKPLDRAGLPDTRKAP